MLLATLLLAGRDEPRELTAYALLLVLGWAAGVVLGHVGRLLGLSAWTWWPPASAPKQDAFFDRRAWALEAVAFAVPSSCSRSGLSRAVSHVSRAGGVLLVTAALLALYGALRTTWSPRTFRAAPRIRAEARRLGRGRERPGRRQPETRRARVRSRGRAGRRRRSDVGLRSQVRANRTTSSSGCPLPPANVKFRSESDFRAAGES